MSTDPNRPESLVAVATEAEAAAIVTDLAEYDIEARFTGDYIADFKAAAPAVIAVQVKNADLNRARQALAEIRESARNVDWAAVDISPEPGAASETEDTAPTVVDWAPHIDRVILTLFAVGAAMSLLVLLLGSPSMSATSPRWIIVMSLNAAALLLLAWRTLFWPR